jgi:hypothetical protein
VLRAGIAVSSPWIRLAVTSLVVGAIPPALTAYMMIQKGGSHIVYCPILPAGHVLPCMPSMAGIGMAALLTVFFAIPVFAIGAIFVWRRGRQPPSDNAR